MWPAPSTSHLESFGVVRPRWPWQDHKIRVVFRETEYSPASTYQFRVGRKSNADNLLSTLRAAPRPGVVVHRQLGLYKYKRTS